MRILGVHPQDHQGVGGALRGQEMAFALRGLGHQIVQAPPGILSYQLIKEMVKPDAVILTGTWHQLMAGTSNAVAVAEAYDSLSIPCIWWYGSNGSVFGTIDPDPMKRQASLAEIIRLICQRKFIGVICPYSMDIYERHGVPRDKMRLVPSVFDANLFTPAESTYDERVSERLRFKFGIPGTAFVIGTVGHTPNSKGGDEAIRAVALLAKEMPDLHYLILHTPPGLLSTRKATSPDGKRLGFSEREVLDESKRLAANCGVANRVHFLGLRLPRISMPTIYRLMHVYVSPSKAENLGQPLVESQLCGLPLVTFKGFSFDYVACPETAEQIEPAGTVTDDYGLVIPQAEPGDLADGIRRARETAEKKPQLAERTRAWTAERFGHQNASIMVAAIQEYGRLLGGQDQVHVGPQNEAMVAGYQAAAERIEAEIGIPRGTVLDVGCNTGEGMEILHARWPEARLCGVESVEAFAEAAKARDFSVMVARAESLPHLDETIDFVFIRHTLEHCSDRARAIGEMHRILRPGGYIYVQAPIELGGTKNPLHLSPFTSHEELRAAFPGFREVYWRPQATVAEWIGQKD